MSVITIVRKAGLSAMAADTLTTAGSRKKLGGTTAGGSKILRCADSLLGFVGYAAHGIVFEHLMRNHREKLDFSGREAIFETALRVHEVLVGKYHLRTSECDSEQPYDSSQLVFAIANAHGIFVVDSYREVLEFTEFWALGSGASYALGSMRSLYHSEGANAEFVAREGAITAASFDIYCGEPVESAAVEMASREETAAV